jgi:hypothetical protein
VIETLSIAALTVKDSKRMKTCSKCGESKPLALFQQRNGRPLGQVRSWCRPCEALRARIRREQDPEKHRAAVREWGARNPDKRRARLESWHKANPEMKKVYRRRELYGTDGVALLQEQGGACAICNTDLAALPSRRRHVDHCHGTGKVRGWLCNDCNLGLGRFQDAPDRLRSAIAYLEKHSA